MNQDSRYIIGIDLGTTNCVVSFIDKKTSTDQPRTELFKVLQVTDSGVVEAKGNTPLVPLPSL